MRSYKPLNTKATAAAAVISAVIAFVYLWFIDERPPSKIAAVLVIPAVLAFIFYGIIKEKKADRLAESERPGYEDGSIFSSAEWRQKYLEYVQSHGWDRIKGRDMLHDVCRRYHSSQSRILIFFGVFFLICSFAGIAEREPELAALMVIIGGAMLALGLISHLGMVFRRWLKNTDTDRQELEDSYMKGRLLVHKTGGINIGSRYILAFAEKSVRAFRPEQITDVHRKIVRLKKYDNSIYTGEEYQHFLVIDAAMPGSQMIRSETELNEFQVEMAMEELSRLVPAAGYDEGSDISEKTEDNIVT